MNESVLITEWSSGAQLSTTAKEGGIIEYQIQISNLFLNPYIQVLPPQGVQLLAVVCECVSVRERECVGERLGCYLFGNIICYVIVFEC